MQDKFNTFYKKWNGKPCEVNDPSNLNQCMDLAYAWLDEIGVTRDTIRHLYAYEVYTKPNDLTVQFFELIPNTPSFIPQVGDICVFEGGIAGHVSIATGKGNLSTFVSFDQNWKETVNKCGEITHSYDQLLGVLRRRREQVAQPIEITDSTIIPLITDSQGRGMEVQAIRSRLFDLNRDLENAQNALLDNASECEKKIASLKVEYEERLLKKKVVFKKQIPSLLYSIAVAIENNP